MSEKSLLNEYCQKNKLNIPEYKSWSRGQPHKLKWDAEVYIVFKNDRHTISTIVACKTKTEAETQAAALMMEYIQSKGWARDSSLGKLYKDVTSSASEGHRSLFETKSKPNKKVGLDIYVVDLENKPLFKSTLDDNSKYIGFIGSLHNSINRYGDWDIAENDNIQFENNNKLLYVLEGGLKDLVDHFMSAFTYPILQYAVSTKQPCTIHIVTGDNAGWCSRACFEKIIKWRKIRKINIVNSLI